MDAVKPFLVVAIVVWLAVFGAFLSDLGETLDFMASSVSDQLDQKFLGIEDGQETGCFAFLMSWALFALGALLLVAGWVRTGFKLKRSQNALALCMLLALPLAATTLLGSI